MRWRPPAPGQKVGPFPAHVDADGLSEPSAEQSQDARPAWLGDPSLLAAFWRYERALMTNDVPELDELFARGDGTIRSEAGSALVGHDAIAAFRATRPPVPVRYLRRVHLRPIDDDSAVIVAESVRGDRGTGSQTQLWQRVDGLWAVTVAHVSTVPGMQFSGLTLDPAEERAIWATPQGRRPLIPSLAYPVGGERMGTLAGVRVAVKDLFAVKGETIGAGNPRFLQGREPETTTAPAVSALVGEGAEITGIAQTDELAFSIAGTNVHYGTPPNPAAPGHTTGGSTSGPASAVALGLADLGLGTDTAGSLRVPGSYCGLYGLRTTHGAVSRQGLVPLAPSFDTVGLLARDLATLALATRALLATGATAGGAGEVGGVAGVDARSGSVVGVASAASAGLSAGLGGANPAGDMDARLSTTQDASAHVDRSAYDFDGRAESTAPSSADAPIDADELTDAVEPAGADAPIRVVVVDPTLVALAEPAARLTFEAGVRALALNSGVDVVLNDGRSALHPDALERWFDAFRLVQQFEAWAEDAAFVSANAGALEPAIAERFRVASTLTEQQAEDARSVLAGARADLDALLPPGTALALPSTSGPAPALGATSDEIDAVRAATLRLTCLASLAGLPALTLPYGRVGTLPTGLCLVGSRGADLALIALAAPR